MRAPNLIHGLTLDIEYDGDAETGDSLAEWLRAVLLPVVDKVLAAQDRQGQVCRIDRLEIDLGSVAREDAEEELTRQLRSLLADALRWPAQPAIAAAGEAGEAGAAGGDEAGAQLLQFLRSGQLPWSIAADPHTAHEQLLRRVLAMPSAPAILASVVQDQHMLARLLRQYKADLLAEVATVLHPDRPAPKAGVDAPESFWQAVLQGAAPGAVAAQPGDPALALFRSWKQRRLELAGQNLSLPELRQWLIWWLMHDATLVNQDCSLMLDAINSQCEQAQDPVQFMRLVLTALREGDPLDLEALSMQSADMPKPAAMDAITTLQSHQAIRNFVGQQVSEQAELANLNSAQLHQLVRSWIGDSASVFLGAIERHALQAGDAHAYFRRILQSLMDEQAIDLESLAAPATPMAPAVPMASAALTVPMAPATPAVPTASAAPAMPMASATPATSMASATPTTPPALAVPASRALAPPPSQPAPLPARGASSAALAPGAPLPSPVREISPLSPMLQQSLPQRLANAMLQADLSALETFWPEITGFHADVLMAAGQRYLRRPQERAQLIARSAPDMLIGMLKAIAPAVASYIEPALRHAESCNAMLPTPLAEEVFHQRVLEFAFQQALDGGQGGGIIGLIESLLPAPRATEIVQQVAHAWRAVLPFMRNFEQALFGDRYLETIKQRLQEDDDAAPVLHAMLAEEICASYPELLDAELREQMAAADLLHASGYASADYVAMPPEVSSDTAAPGDPAAQPQNRIGPLTESIAMREAQAVQPERGAAASSDSLDAEDSAATEVSALRRDEGATVRPGHIAHVVDDVATKMAQAMPHDDHATVPLERARVNTEPLAAPPERSLTTSEVVAAQPDESGTLAEQRAAIAATASAATTVNAAAASGATTSSAIASAAAASAANASTEIASAATASGATTSTAIASTANASAANASTAAATSEMRLRSQTAAAAEAALALEGLGEEIAAAPGTSVTQSERRTAAPSDSLDAEDFTATEASAVRPNERAQVRPEHIAFAADDVATKMAQATPPDDLATVPLERTRMNAEPLAALPERSLTASEAAAPQPDAPGTLAEQRAAIAATASAATTTVTAAASATPATTATTATATASAASASTAAARAVTASATTVSTAAATAEIRPRSQTAAAAEAALAREGLGAEILPASGTSVTQSDRRAAAPSDSLDAEDVAATEASAVRPDERAAVRPGHTALAVDDVATKMAQTTPPDDHATAPLERARMNAEPLAAPPERSLTVSEVVAAQPDEPGTLAEQRAAISGTASGTTVTAATANAATASAASASTASASTAANTEMRLRSQTAAAAEEALAREGLGAEIPAAPGASVTQSERRTTALSDSLDAEDVVAMDASAVRPDERVAVRSGHIAIAIDDVATKAAASRVTATASASAASATTATTAIWLRNQTAVAAEAALAVLLMRAESLGHVEHLAAELMLQRLLRKDSGPLNGALETALSQPSAIARLTELAPAPVLAELLVRLQPALAEQLPSILRAVSSKAEVAQVPAVQPRSTWRTIYQAAFVAADPVTPAEFIRTLTHALGGPELAPPQPVPAATAPQEIMRRLLQPLTARAEQAAASNVSPGSRAAKNDAALSADGEHNIRNAGMVIIATYAQRLFSLLELTKDGQFTSDAAAERAVHLLQYAVTGASATPEYQLALNKLLCGIHGGLPIVPGIDITDKEKDTIEQMLNGVIAHWKALGKTSIGGLRQTFLQREGQLHFEEEAWHLQIPSAIFDMLLDRLPWSFAMIKFPWMPHPLKVTWR